MPIFSKQLESLCWSKNTILCPSNCCLWHFLLIQLKKLTNIFCDTKLSCVETTLVWPSSSKTNTHTFLFFCLFLFFKNKNKQKQTKQTLIRYNGWTEKEWKSSGCPMNPLQKPGAQEHLKLRKTSRDATWHQACRPYSNALDKVLTLFISGLRVSCMLQSPVHLTSV